MLTLLLLFTRKRSHDSKIQRKEAYLTVGLSWFLVCIAGSLPYLISNSIPSVADALFESVSGFTTTGASILTDIEVLPKSILFWRSLTHWIGGFGIIVLVIVASNSIQMGGYHLFAIESSLQMKFKPKLKSVGVRLLFIYLLLTVSEILLLALGGMSLFDSICHSFGTVSTGGFSPRNSSIGGYSPYIQYVIMLFMLLSGTNFVVHYYLLKRDFGKIRQNEELRFYIGMVLSVGLIVSSVLFLRTELSPEESIREGFFQVVSIITCTGYATADYMKWPAFLWILLFLSMFLGGSSGSTSGGIKMARYVVLIKNLKVTFKRDLHPHAVIPVRMNGKVLSDEANRTVLTFIVFYFLFFVVASLLLVILGIDIETASSSVATCMANIGPGIGAIGPAGNFAHLPELVKLLLSVIMIIGRLEIYAILVLFTPFFWTE